MQKIYLITGSTGALGQELLGLWAQKDTLIILLGRNKDRLENQKNELGQRGIHCRVELCDLSQAAEVKQACERLLSENLIPDIIFNCAGIGLKSLAYQGSLNTQLSILRINADSLTFISLFFLPFQVKRGSGVIINISSTGALQPSPGIAVYGATKAYINSLSLALDYECAGTGVKVFTVCPGPFVSESEFAEFVKRPGLFRKQRTLTTKEVALAIQKGIEKNQKLIIPGRLNQILAFFSHHLGIKIIMFFVPFFVKGERLKN